MLLVTEILFYCELTNPGLSLIAVGAFSFYIIGVN